MNKFIYLKQYDKWINPNSIKILDWNKEELCWQLDLNDNEKYLLEDTEAIRLMPILTDQEITVKDIKKQRSKTKRVIKKELQEAERKLEEYKADTKNWHYNAAGELKYRLLLDPDTRKANGEMQKWNEKTNKWEKFEWGFSSQAW